MIKCPNCGSTAQIELVCCDNYGKTNYHEYKYKYSCGCEFEAQFNVMSVKIKEEDKEGDE